MSDRIVPIGDSMWNVRGSFRLFGLLDIGTQCSLVRLKSGRFVMLDSYTLEGDVLDRVLALTDGGAALDAIVNLHPFHTVHVDAVARRFPKATLYGTRRHVEKSPDLPWATTRSDDPEMNRLFDEELRFMVPAGVQLIPADESVHAGSVLALHRPSRALHVDDTLTYIRLPLIGGLRFHPRLGPALEERPGAAADFRAWAGELAGICAEVDHLCTAHLRRLPKLSGEALAEAVRGALGDAESTLKAHAARWG